MPAALIPKDEVLARLLMAFRSDGYDGASLAALSKRTGLGKSSLYHHFPDGKAQMATAVLEYLETLLSVSFGAALEETTPQAKLDRLVEAIDELYAGGRQACLLERLSASVDRKVFRKPLARVFDLVTSTFAEVGRSAGLSEAQARARAESAVVRIEGALVLVAGTGDLGVFARTLADLRSTFLRRDG